MNHREPRGLRLWEKSVVCAILLSLLLIVAPSAYAIYRWGRAKRERRIERAKVEKPLEIEEIIKAAEKRARRRAEEEQGKSE